VSETYDDSEIEASRAPLMDHLVELRGRLIVCAAAIAIGFAVCFYFSTDIYRLLLLPFERAQGLLLVQKSPNLADNIRVAGMTFNLSMIKAMFGFSALPHDANSTIHLVYTAPLEFFFTKVKLAGFGSIVLTFPVLAFQLYRFVAPGLYKRERAAFLPFLSASPILFVLGASLVYFVMLPFVLWFSLSQQIGGTGGISVQLLPKVSDYLDLVTTLLLAFGLCFQLPVVLALLGLAGIVDSKMLTSGRRYAVVGVFVVAAVLTPPDPVSMMTLAIPGVLLYEISIWCVWLIERRRKREDAIAA
jgi:sec-independent protein translocase protein TatC